MDNQAETLTCKELIHDDKVGKCVLEEPIFLNLNWVSDFTRSYCVCPKSEKEPLFKNTIDNLYLSKWISLYFRNLLHDVLPKMNATCKIYANPTVELPKGAILTRYYKKYKDDGILDFSKPGDYVRSNKYNVKFDLPNFINDVDKERCKCYPVSIMNFKSDESLKHEQELMIDTDKSFIDSDDIDMYKIPLYVFNRK